MAPIYMDHHATTPLDPRVLAVMMPFLQDHFANPSSQHPAGQAIAAKVELARDQIAQVLNAEPRDILFTSGATESINLGLLGAARHDREKGHHIITTETEHPAVLDCCAQLEQEGFAITRLPVNTHGQLDLEQLQSAIREETILVSVMYANHEIGTIQDIAAIGAITRQRKISLLCDATQAATTEPLDVQALNVDLLALSGHKLYGPKGVGLLYIRRKKPRIRLQPMTFGGGQEQGLRSGTLNAPGILGLAEACRIAHAERGTTHRLLRGLHDHLQTQLRQVAPGCLFNGHPTNKIPGNLSVSFPGVDGKQLLDQLPDIALSMGSACTSALPRPSTVLRAIGLSTDLARGTLRFGLGRGNTTAEIDRVCERIQETLSA